tara:strand:+ start:516 stop:884 length:369 start_codon:yes stop_codon:yes gene_type:complete
LIKQLVLISNVILIYEFLYFGQLKKKILQNLKIYKVLFSVLFNKKVNIEKKESKFNKILKILILSSFKILFIFFIIIFFELILLKYKLLDFNYILTIFGFLEILIIFTVYHKLRNFFKNAKL